MEAACSMPMETDPCIRFYFKFFIFASFVYLYWLCRIPSVTKFEKELSP